jgi:carboxylesterase
MSENANRNVILIHGFLGSPQNMQLLGDKLHDYGLDIYYVKIPGQDPELESELLFTYTYKDWLKSIKDQIEKILYDVEAKNSSATTSYLTIIGFSMGALLSIILYKQINFKSNIKANLILLSPAFYINTNFFPSPFRSFFGAVLKQKYKMKYTNPGCNHPRWKNYYKPVTKDIPYRAFFELYKLSKISKHDLKKLSCRMLILHSKKDVLVPYEKIVKITNNIKQNNYTLVLLEKSNHFIQLDFEYDKVSDECVKFINTF